MKGTGSSIYVKLCATLHADGATKYSEKVAHQKKKRCILAGSF